MLSPKLSCAIVAALALPLLACGKSKVAQCNAFVDAAHGAQTVINDLNLESEDPSAIEAEAAKIDAEAKKLESLELKDEKLAGYRNDYATALTKLANNVRDLGKLQKDAQDPAKADTLMAQLTKLQADGKAIEAEEAKIVDEVNTYCTGSK